MDDAALWASLKELRDATESDLLVAGQDRKPGKHSAHSCFEVLREQSPNSKQESSSTQPGGSSTASLAELATLSAQLVDDERWSDALEVVAEEHELNRLAYGEADPHTLEVLGTYAGVLWQLGRGEDARELLEELVEKRTALVVSLGNRDEDDDTPDWLRTAEDQLSGPEGEDKEEQLQGAQAELADVLVQQPTMDDDAPPPVYADEDEDVPEEVWNRAAWFGGPAWSKAPSW